MAIIIFRLKDVPDDEADEVRQLLRDNQLEFYETSAGKWGVSMAAIWLKDDAQQSRARALIDEYQAMRVQQVRAEYERLRGEGELETFTDKFRQRPFAVIMILLGILFLVYLLVAPFTSITL